MTPDTVKDWAIGLPCFVMLVRHDDGTITASVGVDFSEVSIAVREAASDFDDQPEVTDRDLADLDAFVEYVGTQLVVADVWGWHPPTS